MTLKYAEKEIVDAFNKGREKGRLEERERAIMIMVKILNNMPVYASVGYRTEIGDKFREQLQKEIGEEKQDE